MKSRLGYVSVEMLSRVHWTPQGSLTVTNFDVLNTRAWGILCYYPIRTLLPIHTDRYNVHVERNVHVD